MVNLPDTSKNNYISIAKAIGIILMVVGHSGCPTIMGKFIYLFHMPLFFVCSGYFFKEISDRPTLLSFYKKRMKGLYLTYLKWSILFLLLHNSFHYLYITESVIYQKEDYIRQFLKMIAMTDYELLIRPFWFIKELLFASLIVATISYLNSRLSIKKRAEPLFLIALIASVVSKLIPPIPLIGDCSILCLSILYYYSGILINEYKRYIHLTYTTLLLSFFIVVSGSIFFIGTIDMRYTDIYNQVSYYLLSITGIIMVFSISKILESDKCVLLYYIGNHTMPILALNLLALKIGNLIKIKIYSFPIEYLSSYTVIHDYNNWFWLVYTIIGVTIPLLIHYIYHRFVHMLISH
jgi:fucose 4-O-acetylase-like acetyltransferase